MIITALQAIMLITPIAAHSPVLRADIKFNDYNDRFDIDELAKETNKYYAKIENNNEEDGRRKNDEDYDNYTPLKEDQALEQDLEDVSVEEVLGEVKKESQRRQLLGIKEDDFTSKLLQFLSNTRRSGDFTLSGDLFAFHDSVETGDRSESYERNLQSFKALGEARTRHDDFRRMLRKYVDTLPENPGSGRRIGDDAVNPESELLLEHAVPFKVKIKGFLQAPELKKN